MQEMPFAPPGFPNRLEGRTAIQRQYGGLPRAYRRMLFPERRYHPMHDPHLLLVEYRGVIDLLAGGSYNNRYCGIFEVRDGLLVHFTEYFDSITLREAFGDPEALRRTFTLEA